jgi:transcriptional regulator with XRE-family HTH domain
VDVKILRVLGKNLNRLRVNSGVTQEKLSEKSEISLRYLQQLEAGQRNPSVPTLVRLHRALSCKYDDLFRGL